MHHHDGPRVEITVRHSGRLAEPLARAVVEPAGSTLSGDADAWSHVRAHYTAFYRGPAWTDYALIRIDARSQRIELQRFEWFDDAYDKGYQGIVGVTDIPGDALLLVTGQRSSTVVIHGGSFASRDPGSGVRDPTSL